MRILIVDDEPELVEQIRILLQGQGYGTSCALDGTAALDTLYVDEYDLVLLDVMLPEKDGFTVLREMRREGITTPVLMLTARGDVDDRTRGLDLGADDYLGKPFAREELLARIRALLRRGRGHASPLLQVDDLVLDTAAREVSRAGRTLALTPKEFAILEFLLYSRDRAVSRYTMAEHVWGDDFDPLTMSNSIDVHIRNLRRKIGDPEGRLIRTVRGVGYMIRAEP